LHQTGAPNMSQRAHEVGAAQRRLRVLHLDIDAFFVAVEVLRDPSLRGLPVIVGGTGKRGVVAAASYEARAYGVHSAMPTSIARKRCPNAIFLHGDHGRYGEVSAKLHEVFRTVTPVIEPIALDEAFLDIGGAFRLFGDGAAIATTLRNRILDELGLASSVGVARNKLLAKLASEAAKPKASRDGTRPGRGVVVVAVEDELDFLHAHPIRGLWGVGPKTHERLAAIGVHTIGDLAKIPTDALCATLGRASGQHLSQLSMGIDDRPVVSGRGAKSISHEQTFPTDHHDLEALHGVVVRLADAVSARVRAASLAASTVQIKLRFGDFQTITRSVSPEDELTTATQFIKAASTLLNDPELVAAIEERGVRLLGLGAANLASPIGLQLSFDAQLDATNDVSSTAGGGSDADWAEVTETLDDIRARFGDAAIGPGRLVNAREPGPGRELWGPQADKR